MCGRQREKSCRLYYYEEKFSAREPTNKGMEVRINIKNFTSGARRRGGEEIKRLSCNCLTV